MAVPRKSYKPVGADELVKANHAQPIEMSKGGLVAVITALNDTDCPRQIRVFMGSGAPH